MGHVRYATTGSDHKRNVQPIVINHFKGRMALAHNGNLTNSMPLRHQLEEQGSIFHTTTDSEVIAYLSLEHTRALAGQKMGFCTACFGGGYPTSIPQSGEKDRFEYKIPRKPQ